MTTVVQISEKPDGMSFSLWEKDTPGGRMRAKIDAFPNRHPALRATLSGRERTHLYIAGQAKIHAIQAFEPRATL